jgi:polysaccharide biosynthesis protein PslH
VRILWVATKAPAPPVDGGRLVALLTLQALAAAGHELTVVAPLGPGTDLPSPVAERGESFGRLRLVAAPPPSRLASALRGAFGAMPLTVRRHAHPAVRDEVARLLSREPFDVVHAEQPQALAQAGEAGRRAVPLVLRAQNVESDLWAGASRTAGPLRPLLAREARRLAAFEGRAVREAAATVALTLPDAERLASLSGAPERVHHVRAPFPARLPAAAGPLPGAPAVVLFGSGGWRPNEEAARWFGREAWPRVRAALPGAVLHVLGATAPVAEGVSLHPAPGDSREAFAAGALLVVPLHVASGVRMKILEAWARGVPVVSTPTGARGLEAVDGRELLLAGEPDAFAAALRRLHEEPGLAEALVEAGRRSLAAHHDPAAVAARLAAVYAGVSSPGKK